MAQLIPLTFKALNRVTPNASNRSYVVGGLGKSSPLQLVEEQRIANLDVDRRVANLDVDVRVAKV